MISIFGYKNFQSMYQKMFCQKTCLLLLIGGEGKGTMLYLLKLLIHFCTIIHYIVEKM